jgi:hypothetical protein
VNKGKFSEARLTWLQLKNNIIKFHGLKGIDYKPYEEAFSKGDWLLSRTPIDFNRIRMQENLRNISLLIKGKTKEIIEGNKDAILARVKEIYHTIIENYRYIFSRVAKREYVKECRVFVDVIGDDLMELRDMEQYFSKLNDHNLYVKYNSVRKQVGVCEAILPRLVEAFRTAQVKGQFHRDFAVLFEKIEDLLVPLTDVDISAREEEIIKLWSSGKTIPEIAKEINIDVNALAVYMKGMDEKKLKKAK